ncbi:MAG: hypothetical protein K2M04_03650 [Muribaculaceae bacterium]|nr:hypothetical protein [Muribaculaceae bacterium]
MDFKKLNKWALVAILSVSATACSNDDNDGPIDDGTKVELPRHRMFILNEGNWNMNNAGIAFYAPSNPETEMIDDIFYKQNGRRLGDNGQAMIEEDGKIYVAVTGSNYLAKLNSACVEEARISFVNDTQLQGGVRGITEKDGFIYATFYGGYLAKINTKTFEIVEKVKTPGNNLEGVTTEGNNLYVANAYKITTDENGQNIYNYTTDVFVMDLRTLEVKSTLTVSPNPNLLMEESDKVFLISWTNYYDKGYCFQMIDPAKNNAVTELATATHMAAGDDVVYLANSETDWSTYETTNTYFSYDIKAGRINNTSFLKNAPAEVTSGHLYMMTVDDKNGDIYIGMTHYADANGDIYRFKRDGSYVGKIDSGGQNPRAAVFID